MHDIHFFLFFIYYCNLYIIPYKRFHFFIAKNAFCLTFINSGSYYMNVVETGNSFYNLTLHYLPIPVQMILVLQMLIHILFQ